MSLVYNGILSANARQVDTQYRDLVRRTWDQGIISKSGMSQPARRLTFQTMKFDLSNGFPIVTERDLVSLSRKTNRSYMTQAFGEITAFLNGARWLHELEHFGCHWWKPWATEAKAKKRGLEVGDLGPGSYGPIWTAFPTEDGGSFNQVDFVVEQIAFRPELKTHVLTTWHPPSNFRTSSRNQKALVSPCHGNLTIHVYPDHGFFDMTHDQRSADVLVGLPANLAAYSAFMLMLASVTGYKARVLNYLIRDAHIYEVQYPYVERILATSEARPATLSLLNSKDRMQDYRNTDFAIDDYDPQDDRYRIPTPV